MNGIGTRCSPLLLVDAHWQGQPRKLLLQANRNGFFYVLDRTDGKLLLAKPLVKKLTWAKEIGADGRPVMNPNQTPTAEGNTICPAVEGATNFFSTSFSPVTRPVLCEHAGKVRCLFEDQPTEWSAGGIPGAGGGRECPEESRRNFYGPRHSNRQGGLGTSRGGPGRELVRYAFHCERTGLLWRRWGRALGRGCRHREELWSFPFTETLHTSPMTYVFDNQQYVAMIVEASSTLSGSRVSVEWHICGGS